MPTGKDVHQSIRTKLEEVEGRHHAFNDRLHEVEGRIEQCTEERQQLYDRLAHLYLPVLDAKSVATTLKEVQETVQNCFNDKQQKRRQLEEALKRNREDRTASQNQLDQASEAIEAKGRERERIEQSIAGLLAANAAYQQSRAIADQSRQALEVYQSRAKSFAEESRAKRAASRFISDFESATVVSTSPENASIRNIVMVKPDCSSGAKDRSRRPSNAI